MTIITNTLARKNDTVILDNGETFTVTRVARVTNEYGDSELGIFGTNEDGTEFGPYWDTDYAVLSA